MQKKDNKIGNKTTYKEERQIKEKKIEIDLQKNKKNKSKFWLVHMPKKQKKKHAKKFVSDSPGQVDFAITLVVFVLNLPNEQVLFFWKFKLQKDCNQSC